MQLTTLCYIEKDDCYLMLHRIKKEHDVNKDKWIGSAANLRKTRRRRSVFCGRQRRRRD